MLHCPETAAAARLLNELLLVLRTARRGPSRPPQGTVPRDEGGLVRGG